MQSEEKIIIRDNANGEEIDPRKRNNSSNAPSHNIMTNPFMLQTRSSHPAKMFYSQQAAINVFSGETNRRREKEWKRRTGELQCRQGDGGEMA